MLNRLLGSHPDVASHVGEANNLWHPRLYPWHESDIDVDPIWLDPRAYTRASLEHREPGWGLYIRSVFAAYQQLAGGEVFLNKTVMANFMLPQVDRLFPEARFIHLYRHGLAVALSYPRKEDDKFANHAKYRSVEVLDDRERLQDTYAEYWRETILEIEDRRRQIELDSQGRWMEMSYEDFCSDPRAGLNKCLRFMGLAAAKFDFEQAEVVDNRNHKFQQYFDHDRREHWPCAIFRADPGFYGRCFCRDRRTRRRN